MSKITSLTIDRKRWGTGENGGALLKNSNNKMCCLGFFCRSVGFTPKRIRGEGMPSNLLRGARDDDDRKKRGEKLSQLLTGKDFEDKKVVETLADVNDSTSPIYKSNPRRREQRITNLFAKLGVKVSFVN